MHSSFLVLGLSSLLALGMAGSKVLCGQYQKFTSPSGKYTFGTNQWGDDGSGNECITVSKDGTEFNTTWKWTENHLDVHSFPNIRLNSNILPIQLSNMSALNITASWTMAPSKKEKGPDLSAINAAANVIVDMFLDPDKSIANSTTLPQYEVMIWIGSFDGKRPIGYDSSIPNPPQQTIGLTNFTLYMGANTNGQYVYSWIPPDNINNFNEDISPLLHHLWLHKYIDDSNYLGVVQFGTETFHSVSNVTFSTQDFNMSVHSGKPRVSSSDLEARSNIAWTVIVTFFCWALSVWGYMTNWES